jgi:hypothetical protein
MNGGGRAPAQEIEETEAPPVTDLDEIKSGAERRG